MPAILSWRLWTAAVVLGLALQAGAAGTGIPQLKSRVTDQTGTLPAATVAQLEQRLAAFEQEKGAQVAVLMVKSVQPDSIEDYAVRAFEQWKLGRKGVDDGVLLVIAKDDRKLRIEVGYGLEGALNDATAKRIISDDIVPYFKRGDFAAGVDAGVARILRVVGGEPLPPVQASSRGDGASGLPFNPEWLIAGFVLFAVINRVLRAVTGQLPAAGIMGGLFGFIIWLVVSSAVAASIAGVVAFILSLAAGARGIGGSGGDSWASHSGGSWSSGGGGFSGGGGSSGGGGASGSW